MVQVKIQECAIRSGIVHEQYSVLVVLVVGTCFVLRKKFVHFAIGMV